MGLRPRLLMVHRFAVLVGLGRVITTDRFFPTDPTAPYQGTRPGKGGSCPPQIPAEMTEWVTGSNATKKWDPSARGMMAEYHE